MHRTKRKLALLVSMVLLLTSIYIRNPLQVEASDILEVSNLVVKPHNSQHDYSNALHINGLDELMGPGENMPGDGAEVVMIDNAAQKLFKIPEKFRGQTFIQTYNQDKFASWEDYIQFDISKPADVYVFYAKTHTKTPNWMSGFVKTDDFNTNDPLVYWGSYRKTFPAGTVTLGGCRAEGYEGGGHNYFVVIMPATGEPTDPIDPIDPVDPVDPEEPIQPEIPLEPNVPDEPVITPRPEPGLIYYVADSQGDDENGNGTLENPFKTLEKARDRIRELKNGEGLPEGGVMVYLREGKYKRIDSFELGIQDSGTAESPITYAAYPGEQVSITGGHLLANSHFSKVVDPVILNRLPEEARGKVYQYDLRQDGITDYGMIERSGFQWTRKPPAVELFFNDQAMTLARYPNDGYVRVLSVVQPGSAALFGHTTDDGAIFTYQGDRPSRWSEASDIWVDGFWWIDYASSTLKVDQIDTIKKEITGAHATGYPVTAGDRYFYYNLLEEIDMPGEWYLDRETGLLYVYPPGELEGSNIQLSAMEDTMIIMNQVSHVQLVGLTIEGTRGAGIQIKGGTSVFIDGCEIARLGMDAISVDGGSNHGIVRSEIYDVGMGGITLKGGNRNTLAPSGHFAMNNNIYRFSRVVRAYTPAVSLEGVGNRVSYNRIHDAPHMGIRFSGNDHIMEYNEFYNLGYETSDVGIIYSYNDFSTWGNVIRYNYFQDIYGHTRLGVRVIYLDNYISGTYIIGNVFKNVDRAIFVHGGRSNKIINNMIMDSNESIRINTCSYSNQVPLERLAQLPYQSEIWRTKYPEIINLPQDEPQKPKYNWLEHNLVYNTVSITLQPDALANGTIKNNYEQEAGSGEPLFMDIENQDYRIRYDAMAKNLGVKDIDFERIGLKEEFAYGDKDEILQRIFIKSAKSHSGEAMMEVSTRDTEAIGLVVSGRTLSGYIADLSDPQRTSIRFQSEDPDIVEVDSQGIVHPKEPGIAKIQVVVEKDSVQKTAYLYLMVDRDVYERLEEIQMSLPQNVMKKGSNAQLQLNWKTPMGYKDLLEHTAFESSDEEVLTVNEAGVITAHKSGTAIIKAVTVWNEVEKEASIEVQVYETLMSSLSAKLNRHIIGIGEYSELVLEVTMDNQSKVIPTEDQVVFMMEDGQVVTVDEDRKVHGLKEGREKITVKVTVNGITMSNTLNIAVYEKAESEVPEAWSVTNFSPEVTQGFAQYDAENNSFLVTSTGPNVWGLDKFTFLHQEVNAKPGEKVSISAKIHSIYHTTNDAAAGVTIRENDTAQARHVTYRIKPNGRTVLVYRKLDGSDPNYKQPPQNSNSHVWYLDGVEVGFPAELKLEREGDLFVAYHKDTNGDWVKDLECRLVEGMDYDMVAGIGLFSNNIENPTESKISDVQIHVHTGEGPEEPEQPSPISFDAPVFTDTMGNQITDLRSADSIQTDLSITNNRLEIQEITMIVGVYGPGNRLIQLGMDQQLVDPNETAIFRTSFEMQNNVEEGSFIKIMLWENFDTMIPLAKPILFSNPS